jgi:hypothetical protein
MNRSMALGTFDTGHQDGSELVRLLQKAGQAGFVSDCTCD